MRGPTILALTAATLLTSAAAAQAGCVRRIVNRSPLLVTVALDGGPVVSVPPGRSRPIRYVASGRLDVSAFCPSADPAAAPVFHDSYGTTAVLDRCYVEIGDGFFEPALGKGFAGTADTKPLAVNTPRQGDIVAGPYGVSCPLPPAAARISARF